jgi:hypothetical protein
MELLTGECKKAFEEWYYHKSDLPQCYDIKFDTEFYNLHPSMRWGVYQDFFDSVGIAVNANRNYSKCLPKSYGYYGSINCKSVTNTLKSREQARTEAIKKANEIFNNK